MDLSTLATDLFEQYRAINEAHPLLGAMGTAAVIFPTADITSQALTDRSVNWRKVGYTLGLAPIYGALGYISLRSGHWVGEHISDHALVKAALGPNLLGLGVNLFFFVNNVVGERSNYHLRDLASHYASFCKDLLLDKTKTAYQTIKEKITSSIPWREYRNSAIGTLTFWNAFQYFNYSYTPEELQTPASLAVSLCWIVLMSFWSLQGRKEKPNPG